AIQRVSAHSMTLGSEMVKLEESYARMLAEVLIANHDVPPYNRSAFEGYAVRAEDTTGETSDYPVHFHVPGNIGAGHTADKPLKKGEAYRIMTGAASPENTDGIIIMEATTET